MANMAQNKGKRGEREVVDILQPIVDKTTYDLNGPKIDIQRSGYMQSDMGGSDIAGLPWLAIEVKRHETEQIEQWWKQCREQAKHGQTPVLLWRVNNGKWRCRMYGGIGCDETWWASTVDTSLPNFLTWFAMKLEHELLKTGKYKR